MKILALLAVIGPAAVSGAVYNVNPSNYAGRLSRLRPGDTLSLAPGSYPHLSITGLRGTPEAWITITGPDSGPPARVVGAGCCNTVEILNCSYLAVRRLTIDSAGIDGAAGLSAKDGASNLTHDILVESNTFVGQHTGQQTDGISTKTPTWGWIIRNNAIVGAGTGIYLGNSDGSMPFVGGIIENNLIKDTIGYNIEIKWQRPRPSIAGMPAGQSSTILRNNVFIKNNDPSPDGDRPNVLVGGFPNSGPGSTDLYEIYGNLFYHNPREALLQASGRVSVHDNLFVDGDPDGPVAVFKNHDLPLKLAYVYNNTVYTTGEGILFFNSNPPEQAVVGNLIFGRSPLSGSIANASGNITDTFANAGQYVAAPSIHLGAMDFYPRMGKAQGAALDLSKFATEREHSIDFNGMEKSAVKQAVVFRGAYAGEGANPGWKLQAAIKGSTAPPPSLAGLECAPTTLYSGRQSDCRVWLSSAPSDATNVALATTRALVSAPAVVTVPAGAKSAAFTLAAGNFAAGATAAVTATLSGSAPVTAALKLAVATGAGSLAGSVGPVSGPVNLTAEGSRDWVHWGLKATADPDRKARVVPEIGNFTMVGGGQASRFPNNLVGFTWTDGTPAASTADTTTGVYVSGEGKGFRIILPADTTVKTLKVYVGLWRAQGRMTAQLSDGSAAAYTDASLHNSDGSAVGVYTFVYSAASAGQTLTLTYTQDSSAGGNVTLQAATLR